MSMPPSSGPTELPIHTPRVEDANGDSEAAQQQGTSQPAGPAASMVPPQPVDVSAQPDDGSKTSSDSDNRGIFESVREKFKERRSELDAQQPPQPGPARAPKTSSSQPSDK